MIGFHLELGYQSGYLGGWNEAQQWDFLVGVVKQVHLTDTFIQTVKQYGFPDSVLDDKCPDIVSWTESYLNHGALSMLEAKKVVMIIAGGGHDFRTAKESIALAVCHITMIECAKKGFHVNLTTA